MAIFNLDYINESKKNDYVDGILDSMLEACDTMLDSVEMLQEKGAYGKYVDKLADEEDRIEKKYNAAEKRFDKYDKIAKYNDSIKNTPSYKKSKEDFKYYEKELENAKSSNTDKIISNTFVRRHFDDDDKENIGATRYKYGKLGLNDELDDLGYDEKNKMYSDLHYEKQRWNKKHGDVGEDKLAARPAGLYKNTEGLSAKKKAVREACEYMLSALDSFEED